MLTSLQDRPVLVEGVLLDAFGLLSAWQGLPKYGKPGVFLTGFWCLSKAINVLRTKIKYIQIYIYIYIPRTCLALLLMVKDLILSGSSPKKREQTGSEYVHAHLLSSHPLREWLESVLGCQKKKKKKNMCCLLTRKNYCSELDEYVRMKENMYMHLSFYPIS